ncbi:peptide/nickel transport system substrate-binding protein [Desulfitispora alkaliphila]|uniref:ABC transporter substrate-binding protein n=1 Tax=Desulfitispora alkaliphila TaxID=622674 RepID=UPI003D218A1A
MPAMCWSRIQQGLVARKWAILCIALILSMVMLVGCGGSEDVGEKDSESVNTFVVACSTGDWGYPTPYQHYQRGPGYVRMSYLFDKLIWKDKQDFIPALAEEWEYLEEEIAYRFVLNEGVTWHDGEDFTSRDVAFTFEYMKEHPYTFVSDIESVDRAEVISDREVIVYLKEPSAPFLNNVAATVPMLPEHIWSSVDNPMEFSEPEAVMGTGPFILRDYNREQGTYLYEKNPDYYGGQVQVDRLQFVKISDEMAPATLKRGDVHFATVPSELVEEIKEEGLTVVRGTYDWNAKLMINHQKEPMSDVRFRQALAYAIDREELVRVVLRGNGVSGNPGLLSKDSQWYNPNIKQYNHDPEKARTILEAMEIEELKLELVLMSRFEREAENIKRQLEQVGIEVNLRSLENTTLDSRVSNWEFDIALSGHGGLGSDPHILNRMILGEHFNSARYRDNEQLTKLLQEQAKIMDEDLRREKVDRIQELYSEDVPCLTLYYPDSIWGHDGRFEFYVPSGGMGGGVPIAFDKMSFVQ